MSKFYQKVFPGIKKAGFTLIELLVVVLIIGILAAVALPQYEKAVAKSRFIRLVSAGKTLKDAMEVYYLANGDYPQSWSQLDVEYPGCPVSTSGRYMMWCDTFAVDMFASAHANLVFTDTHGLPDSGKNMSSTDLLAQGQSSYTVWLDKSEKPGQTACRSQVAGLCAGMGY